MMQFKLYFLAFSFSCLTSSVLAAEGDGNGIDSPTSPGAAIADAVNEAIDTANKEYVVWPKDGKNEGQLTTTEKLIKSLLKLEKVYSYRDIDNELLFWKVKATDNQVKTLKDNVGVQDIEENKDVNEPHAAMPLPSEAPHLMNKFDKRDLTYTTQTKPDQSELVMVSQPTTVPKLEDLENYVYESHGGEGIWLYHVEHGIDAANTDEFPTDRVEFLQTQESKDANEDERKDGSKALPNKPLSEFHSTATASKAAGSKYGACKKCKIVVVKMQEGWSLSQSASIFDFVHKDIKAKPERKKKCVITTSWGGSGKTDPNFLGIGQNRQRLQIEKLLKDDVIFVTSAGNNAKFEDPDDPSKKRTEVDSTPGVFEKDTVPIINVGAVDFTGAPADFSQGGPRVKILGPGVGVKTAKKESKDVLTIDGTSFSAPLVAGVIANYLAYDKAPFDQADGKLAGSVRDYLAKTANWERKAGTKVIWNEVTEKENPKKSTSTQDEGPIIAPNPGECENNQVQGSCKQPKLPTAPDFSGGKREPACNKVDNGLRMINKAKAEKAAKDYCTQLKAAAMVLDENKKEPPQADFPYVLKDAAKDGSDLVLKPVWDKTACPPDKSTDKLDFGKMEASQCEENMIGTVAQVCAEDPPKDPNFSLYGGVWANDCGIWGSYGQFGAS